ncbi:reverse transcriptase domain-containing protein [Tanacetum coccineum]
MTSITSAWPFSQWGIDIIGPLPTASGGARFLVVAIDYFTKWVEAKPLISTTGRHMEIRMGTYKTRNSPSIHVCLSPSGKWAGRSDEQRNRQRHGIKTRNGTPNHPHWANGHG